jgi:hypothetical protein
VVAQTLACPRFPPLDDAFAEHLADHVLDGIAA